VTQAGFKVRDLEVLVRREDLAALERLAALACRDTAVSCERFVPAVAP